MKKRRHRLERAARWGSTLFAVLLTVLWLFTIRRDVFCMTPEWSPGRFGVVQVRHGKALFDYEFQPAHNKSARWMIQVTPITKPGRTEWVTRWTPGVRQDAIHIAFFLPLWIPILASTATSAWLWNGLFRSRAQVKNSLACPECLYSRTGLAPGAPCPECGTLPNQEAAG